MSARSPRPTHDGIAKCCASPRRRCRTPSDTPTRAASSCASAWRTAASCSRWRTTARASTPTRPSCVRAGSGSRRWRSVPCAWEASSASDPRRGPAPPSTWRCPLADDPIRVLVVDDHAVVREGLRGFLALQDGIEVAGEASDGEEAIEQAERLKPDVVLMDLVMPKRDGIDAMRALRERVPGARVIVLTSFLDDDKLMPALRAGAAGYLLKDARPQEIARAVRAAHDGEALLDPVVAAQLVENLASHDDPLDRLTPREREVLELIGRGFANKRIALELRLSEKTVKTHVGHVLEKLDVADRTQAAVVAVRAGLVGETKSPRTNCLWNLGPGRAYRARYARRDRHRRLARTRTRARARPLGARLARGDRRPRRRRSRRCDGRPPGCRGDRRRHRRRRSSARSRRGGGSAHRPPREQREPPRSEPAAAARELPAGGAPAR